VADALGLAFHLNLSPITLILPSVTKLGPGLILPLIKAPP
jgi:hypothetical protein